MSLSQELWLLVVVGAFVLWGIVCVAGLRKRGRQHNRTLREFLIYSQQHHCPQRLGSL
jgi:hypothetical protein